jgi:hypothetical protein
MDTLLLVYFSWYSEEYDWFYIDNEAQFYTLHVSMLSIGDAGDSLNAPWDLAKSSTGMKFSSQDADNDMSMNNCAMQSGGGWWFNSCSHSKMLGDPATGSSAGYQWHGLINAGRGRSFHHRLVQRQVSSTRLVHHKLPGRLNTSRFITGRFITTLHTKVHQYKRIYYQCV